MDEKLKQGQVKLSNLVTALEFALIGTFRGSREGFPVVDVDGYFKARHLLEQLAHDFDAEVFRVCFEERLSNRSLPRGD